MRKYILSIILISAGLLLLIFNYSKQKGSEYTETTFSTQAHQFEKVFDKFTSEVNENIHAVKGHFNDTLKIKDTIATRNYCLNQLTQQPYLMSVGIFQKDYKVVAKKENSSFVFAIDSTAGIDVVRWQRFEKGKQVSSWYESFEVSINNSAWYQDLLINRDQLKWHINTDVKTKKKDRKDLIYAGYSYSIDGQVVVVLLEFSREKLLREFDLSKGLLNLRLSFMNTDGKESHVNTSTLSEVDSALTDLMTTDSVQINIAKHFTKFKAVPQGNFNFVYNNEVYWNSFKRFSEESGIQYYLFTLSETDLQSNSRGFLEGLLSWVALGLIVLGGLLLAIRKRFFYRPNRMQIPSVQEILKQDENRYLEFKSSLRWDHRQEKVNPELEKIIMKTIAAFGNTDGGILLIGVDDDKNIIGLERDFQTLKKSDADYYEVHLRNLMHKLMGVKYVSKYIRTQFETCNDKKMVCKIKVIPADEPLFLKYTNKNGQSEEKFYVRSGNSSHEIDSIADINDYVNKKFK